MGGKPEHVNEDELLADSDSSGDSSSSEENKKAETSKQLDKRATAANFFIEEDGDNDSDDSSDSSDSDSAMEVDEDLLQTELTNVNDKLAAEPYSYDLYLEKIRILKSLGELDRLRDVREKMSKLYPLSPSLWTDWVKDEQKMISTKEEKDYVISLMDRAVNDYSSVEVWLEYINFCLGQMQEEESGVEMCRNVFERALGNCGLNVAMGSLVWDTYRNFEAALLATKTTETELAEQEKRYVGLCKRQLAVPLLAMQETYQQMEAAVEIDENTDAAYKKALARLKELESWEAKLVQASDATLKVQVYKDYIRDELKTKCNPARIQCLYERAITDSPLDVTVWTEYIDYLSKNLKVVDLILKVAERATRNCPWVLSVWTKYMWVVETFLKSEEDDGEVFEKIKTVFENAIVYCGGVGDQAGTLWLKYLEFLRRRVKSSPADRDAKKFEILRKTFTAAETHLLQLVEEPNEYICQILQFRVRFEAGFENKMTDQVRELWKELLSQRGYGTQSRVWCQYISQEIKYGADVKKLRSELTRAMSQVQDDPNTIADMWLNFERDNGDLITLSNAETKISTFLEKSAQYSTNNNNYNQQYNQYDSTDSRSKYSKGQQNQNQGRKRKFDEQGQKSAPAAFKKGKPADETDGGFKVPAIPAAKSGIKFVPAGSTGTEVVSMDDQDKKSKATNPPPAPVKHDSSKDHRTIFLSNLDYKVEDEPIRDFFKDCGAIEEVRLVRDFQGRSKGFGYVFFEQSESVATALQMDRKPLEGRPAFVSKCDPDKSTRQVQFRYSTELEKNKLFVKGLPFSMTSDELKKLFEEFGTLKDCRLVTHRNGHSKGIAYVEYNNAASASAAILKTDGEIIDGHAVSVAISNPPPKNKPRQFSSSFSKPVDTSQRRTRNAFVPRAVQVQPSTSAKQQSDALPKKNESPVAQKSNDEFRKLFMKK